MDKQYASQNSSQQSPFYDESSQSCVDPALKQANKYGNQFMQEQLSCSEDLPDGMASSPLPQSCGMQENTGSKAADWAQQEYTAQDSRFFDSTTKDFWDKLYNLSGYPKCNQFVAAAFKEGAGVDYPQVDGRDPVASELANSDNFKEEFSYTKDPAEAGVGDMVVWYDAKQGIHHSAIITGVNEQGEFLVTYAGAGEKIKQIPISQATARLKNVAPAFRRWIEDVDQKSCTP